MITNRHSREDSLDTFHLLDLYRGGLRINDRDKRLLICLVILLTSRLGMRIGEVMHIHEGWINWKYGYIQIPRYEPCGCKYCWKRAQSKAERDDEATIDETLYQRQWEPKTEMGARVIPFNWSVRITACLLAFFNQEKCVDHGYQYLRRLLRKAAENSNYLHPDHVNLHALRATAETWWADISLDKKARRDLGGWETDRQAWKYTATSPVILSNKIRRTLNRPPLDSTHKDPVSLTPNSLPREPFEIKGIDPAARYSPYEPGPIRNPRTPVDNIETGEAYDPMRHESLLLQSSEPFDRAQREEMMVQHMSDITTDHNRIEDFDPWPTKSPESYSIQTNFESFD